MGRRRTRLILDAFQADLGGPLLSLSSVADGEGRPGDVKAPDAERIQVVWSKRRERHSSSPSPPSSPTPSRTIFFKCCGVVSGHRSPSVSSPRPQEPLVRRCLLCGRQGNVPSSGGCCREPQVVSDGGRGSARYQSWRRRWIWRCQNQGRWWRKRASTIPGGGSVLFRCDLCPSLFRSFPAALSHRTQSHKKRKRWRLSPPRSPRDSQTSVDEAAASLGLLEITPPAPWSPASFPPARDEPAPSDAPSLSTPIPPGSPLHPFSPCTLSPFAGAPSLITLGSPTSPSLHLPLLTDLSLSSPVGCSASTLSPLSTPSKPDPAPRSHRSPFQITTASLEYPSTLPYYPCEQLVDSQCSFDSFLPASPLRVLNPVFENSDFSTFDPAQSCILDQMSLSDNCPGFANLDMPPCCYGDAQAQVSDLAAFTEQLNAAIESLEALPVPNNPSPEPVNCSFNIPCTSIDSSEYSLCSVPFDAPVSPVEEVSRGILQKKGSIRPFLCSDCGKAFRYACDLRTHERIHTGEKPFPCDLCPKTFAQKSQLRKHLKLHEGRKDFVCPVCSRAFFEKKDLVNHSRIHSGEKPFTCPECHVSFGRQHTLNTHRRTHTGEKPFRCEHCGSSFVSNSVLRIHMRLHSGEKPHKCDKCSRAFTRPHRLADHRKIHESTPGASCDKCGVPFNNAIALKRHQRLCFGIDQQ